MSCTTVGELKERLCGVLPERDVVIGADLQGDWISSFPGIDERAVVCGYYAVDKVCVDNEVILMTGEEVLL